ncbi:MAG: ABC transporter ATP-binding protein [Clostridia bacterium]|nr:ABC transporter ATP-binding protein [Clostridia bacterium]
MLYLDQISFSYGQKKVLENLSLTLNKGELLAVMGPSGCGKSTLLHLIAGLKKPTGGSITANAARISYVFQEPRLFPWLTLEENLRAVLNDQEAEDGRIAKALEAVGLSDAAALYPSQLSGGMKSRASLARALAFGGDLFLLDEPFASLDEVLCGELCVKLRAYFKENGISAILVTHRTPDAQVFADRILQM